MYYQGGGFIIKSNSILNAKIKVNKELLVAFVFLMYFCRDIFVSLYVRALGTYTGFTPMYNIAFWSIVCFYCIITRPKRMIQPLICYLIICVLFVTTYIVHPEYKEWFFEKTFGIHIHFFQPSGGIWALLVISLVSDRDELYRYLKLAMIMSFAFLIFRYLSIRIRGYVVSLDYQYNEIRISYDMKFGYDMMICTIFFFAEAFIRKHYAYYIPALMGLFMILTAGSRGAIIWPILSFTLMIPIRWKTFSKRTRNSIVVILIIFFCCALSVFIFRKSLAKFGIELLEKLNISSRTLTSLLSGDFSDPNGRDDIYKITIQRIKEGGLFGHGVFGERVAVGQKYRYGYAHNFFLEVYAAFGYLGGSIACFVLIINIVLLGKNCRTSKEQIVFTTFLLSSCKLLLSDSFWFNSSFWALIGLILQWRNQDIEAGLRQKFDYTKIFKRLRKEKGCC